MRIQSRPQPDVCVQQQLHLAASQSSQLLIGPTMSPRIFIVPAIDPSLLPAVLMAEGGTTSATASPKRVTRIGVRVFRTCSRMPRHLALNSEMAISFIACLYHGQ